MRENVAFDFDGVVHENPEWAPKFSAIDIEGLELFQNAGYAVSIMTCNDVDRVAAALRRFGFDTYEDHRMRLWQWNGGRTGLTVLVTNRKVSAAMYLDDRGFRFRFGDDWQEALAELGQRQSEPAREVAQVPA